MNYHARDRYHKLKRAAERMTTAELETIANMAGLLPEAKTLARLFLLRRKVQERVTKDAYFDAAKTA